MVGLSLQRKLVWQRPGYREKMSAIHRGKPSPMKGRKLSDEAKEKISKALLGKKRGPHSEETKAKISKSHAGKCQLPHSEEAKAKMSESQLSRWSNNLPLHQKISSMYSGQGNPFYGKRHLESTKATIKELRANQIPKFSTKIERIGCEILTKLGILFLQHRVIPGLSKQHLGFFHIFDVIIPEKKIAIEWDGCYWHNCKVCKLQSGKTALRDFVCELLAVSAGWTVKRFWEHDILRDDFMAKLTEEVS